MMRAAIARPRLAGRTDRSVRPIATLVLLFLSACCFPYRGYEGDGTFRDTCSSSFSAERRCQIDFGAVDFSTTSRHVFRFGKLPKAKSWMVGLAVEPEVGRPAQDRLDDAVVSMLVTNERNESVIAERKRINDWVWELIGNNQVGIGPSFVYLRGQSRDIPIDNNGTIRIENTGIKADGGWGTYFEPRHAGRYTLVLTVEAPDPSASHFSVHPVVYGSNYMGSL